MSISPIHGTSSDEKDQRWFFSFYEQWSTLFRRINWNDFTLIKIAGERALYSGRLEVELALLGFQVTITYVFDNSFNEKITDFKSRVEADLKGRTGAAEIVDPTGALDKLLG